MNGQEYKIFICGMHGSGKSALTLRFLFGNYKDDQDAAYVKQVQIDQDGNNFSCILSILDDSTLEEFSSFTEQWMKESDGFLLVYDVTSRVSFEEAGNIYKKIIKLKKEHGNKQVPIVIVGNKCDLEDQRQVTQQEGMKYAQKCNIPFYETSPKEDINNDECFYQLAREIRRIQSATSEPPKNKLCPCLIL